MIESKKRRSKLKEKVKFLSFFKKRSKTNIPRKNEKNTNGD